MTISLIAIPNEFSAGVASSSAVNANFAEIQEKFNALVSRWQGTALIAADFALSGGWGTTASVGTITGTDGRFRFTVTSAGTGQGASPTVTLTFTGGTFTTAPFAVSSRGGGSQPTVNASVSTTPTTLVLTFNGTPVAAETYTFNVLVIA